MNETYECEGYLSIDANRAHLQEIHTLIRALLTTRLSQLRLYGYGDALLPAGKRVREPTELISRKAGELNSTERPDDGTLVS
jgi:hypothetical protein